MPVFYDVFPKYKLLLYICIGTWTGSAFFETADRVTQDAWFEPDMKIMIDTFSSEIDTSLSGMYLAIERNKKLKRDEQALGQTAVLTHSTSLKLLADALRLMSPDAPSNFGVFNNRQDAIHWLGFSFVEKDIVQFWEAAKHQCLTEQ